MVDTFQFFRLKYYPNICRSQTAKTKRIEMLRYIPCPYPTKSTVNCESICKQPGLLKGPWKRIRLTSNQPSAHCFPPPGSRGPTLAVSGPTVGHGDADTFLLERGPCLHSTFCKCDGEAWWCRVVDGQHGRAGWISILERLHQHIDMFVHR